MLQYFPMIGSLLRSSCRVRSGLISVHVFPPFDVYSIANSNVPVFAGFDFYFKRSQHMVVNSSVLSLELFVVLGDDQWKFHRRPTDRPEQRRTDRRMLTVQPLGLFHKLWRRRTAGGERQFSDVLKQPGQNQERQPIVQAAVVAHAPGENARRGDAPDC